MADIDDHRTFVYRIDADNKILFVNQEWIAFARENEAPELTPEHVLGQLLDRFIAGWESKHLYELVYRSARQKRRVIHIPFRCDSPVLRRSLHMRLVPLERGILEFNVKVEAIETLPPRPLLDNRLQHSSQVVVICSWCKRILLENGRWVEIEQAIKNRGLFGATPPSLTHGVCPDCFTAVIRQI